jgi:hypothetical protein
VTLVSVFFPPPTNVALVPAQYVWRYRDDDVDLGTAWRGPAYADGAWPAGRAKLGFGMAGLTTVLNDSPDNKTAFYFRHAFQCSPDLVATNVMLRLQRDDGIAVYLNGTEIARNNLPDGPLTHATAPPVQIAGPDETFWLSFPVPSALLRAGSNVVAAEVHYACVMGGYPEAHDVGFDLELLAQGTWLATPAPPELSLQRLPGGGLQLGFPGTDGRRFVIEASDDFASWVPVSTNVVTGGHLVFTADTSEFPRQFYRARYAP